MSKKARRDYLQIEANMREIRRYQKSLDNQTILARCNCSHCITGECMAIKPSNNITTLPDGRKVVDVTCGICGKKVTFTKFTDEQFQEACDLLDAVIDQLKMIDTHFGMDEDAMLILSNNQQGIYYLRKLYERHTKQLRDAQEKKNNNNQNASHSTSSYGGSSSHMPRNSGWTNR